MALSLHDAHHIDEGMRKRKVVVMESSKKCKSTDASLGSLSRPPRRQSRSRPLALVDPPSLARSKSRRESALCAAPRLQLFRRVRPQTRRRRAVEDAHVVNGARRTAMGEAGGQTQASGAGESWSYNDVELQVWSPSRRSISPSSFPFSPSFTARLVSAYGNAVRRS